MDYNFIVWVLKYADDLQIAEVCVSGAGAVDPEMQVLLQYPSCYSICSSIHQYL